MGERFIFTRHRTRCHHCGEAVGQIIKAVSAQAQIVCSVCGVTRIFVPRLESSEAARICTPIGRRDLLDLETDARCKNCGVTGPHGLTVGYGRFTTRCRDCGYTHFYRFDLEYTATCPIDGEVSAPPVS